MLHWETDGTAERETCLQVRLQPITTSVTWVCVSGLSIPICTISTTKDVVTSPSQHCY